MKKTKGKDCNCMSMDRISDLPKDILHRILYFLSQEDAVRTFVLSNSWRYVWCTRPNLDFSDINFKGNKQDFLLTVDKTLQQYYDQGLSLEKFRLYASLLGKDYSHHESVLLLEKWVPLLTGMGVKAFSLSIISDRTPGITDLSSVVFKADSLEYLHLNRCNLGQNIPENIPFVRLQVLRLQNVLIEEEIFEKIVSGCPLLTTMWFRECKGLKNIKLEKKLLKYLKKFSFINRNTPRIDECIVEIDFPSLEKMEIIGSKIRFHIHKFDNLKTWCLDMVEIFSSDSIEQSELCIDAPNIEYFYYSGCFMPSVTFAPTSVESILKLYIRDYAGGARLWFLGLSKLLQALRNSVVLLSVFHLAIGNMHVEQDILEQDIINNGGGNNKPIVVDFLRLSFVNVPSLVSFLNGLFRICRPRIIFPCWFPRGIQNKERENEELSEFWCTIQMMRESGSPNQIWQDLEDLSIESFDMSRKK
ncbi:PREDICTED: putative F-box/LRR-repeat protein At3g18150 [Erythranthe guttata]|uniref:putative F-box/LRR-repeat protein At3g18150 n=1 Tax=Erythranthe guttata TaxID=4155 RepID=UPI00064D7DE8|nr:PREDICTED: putative F-box/LRR-repeat protein At3g18150 [Erythranthe guttata]|eukprot:XP_012839455.1 PREDICTED: putative F-box/LRR-repeat protein At3g18150 [Erythranthe guttata]